MNNRMEYKGYQGSVEYSAEDNCLWGKVLNIRSLIMYDGISLEEIKSNFEDMVDDYLESCQEYGITPETPQQELPDIELPPDLHKRLVAYSFASNKDLGLAVREAISEYLIEKE